MSPRRSYVSLDAWRGVAALLVVAFHTTEGALAPIANSALVPVWQQWVARFLCHADLGVMLFFVISGYCITGAAEGIQASSRSRFSNRTDSARMFLIRRFRRIYPPFWAALVLTVVVDATQMLLTSRSFGSVAALQMSTLQQVLGNLLLLEDARPAFSGDPTVAIMKISWSLCYEIQFYLLVALLILWPARLYRNFGIITALAFGSHALQSYTGEFPLSRTLFDGTWLYFATGILVRYALHCSSLPLWWWRGLFLSALVGLFASVCLLIQSQLISFLVICTAFGAILLLLFPDDAALEKNRYVGSLMRVGRYSYSLYLTHAVIVWLVAEVFFSGLRTSFGWTVFFVLPLSMVVSAIVAKAFFLMVEGRFINRSDPNYPASFLSTESPCPEADILKASTNFEAHTRSGAETAVLALPSELCESSGGSDPCGPYKYQVEASPTREHTLKTPPSRGRFFMF